MQEQTIEIDVTRAKENFSYAISRLERAISALSKKNSTEEQTRNQVINELDTYIASLETLLNPKKK